MATFRKVATLAVTFIGGGIAGSKLEHLLKQKDGYIKKLEAAAPLDINRPNEIMRFGFPNNGNINIKKNYVLGYDNRLRNASWVFEHINKDLLNTKQSDRLNSSFSPDSSIHPFFRGTNQDFWNSGYDRGHLAAASNHRASQEWMDDTFHLSNIVPQNPIMNQQAWNNLEKYVRSLAYHYDNVYVCTGPLYLPKQDGSGKMRVSYQVIGRNHIAVPTHLYKVVVCERNSRFELLSYVMANEWVDPSVPLKNFLYPIEAIERASGLLFFDRIPRERFWKINHGKETEL
uniref:endonuclease G, mitochondrial-like n=1 Tax=Styela clava TaxID=7725 RepID=UPI00193A2989|nr:endonuclease G, mitochondrial-like [Styela clava]